jgi:hypothetical protein
MKAHDRRTVQSLPGPGRMLMGQLGYQLRLLARTPRAAFSVFLLPVLLLVAFHLSGVRTPGAPASPSPVGSPPSGSS